MSPLRSLVLSPPSPERLDWSPKSPRQGNFYSSLWAFLDKTFGLGYATPAANAWVDGGSPTKGFLGNVQVGPMQSTLQSVGRQRVPTGCS